MFENLNNSLEGKLSIVYGLCISLFYLVLVFLELRKYKQLLLENHSNQSTFNYKWLYQLFILLCIIFCFSFFKQIYKLFGTDVEILNYSRLLLSLLLVGFLSWIVLKSMYYPHLFRNINSTYLLTKNILKDTGNQKQPEKPAGEEIEKLLAYMEEEEPYLDASLTLHKLAKELDMPSRELSILINLKLKQHFFDFVNQYRINKAENMLLNSTEEKLTVQQIMYDVGFNSKSSFYTAFKKKTGMTPSEYKKKAD
ncbi:MAG: AraC family transcriptional regulator [Bacteroidia bacterium]|nr:AraC family transcriptional regulator [Bacteroidia bacterium]